jgi:hypothetical protein
VSRSSSRRATLVIAAFVLGAASATAVFALLPGRELAGVAAGDSAANELGNTSQMGADLPLDPSSNRRAAPSPGGPRGIEPLLDPPRPSAPGSGSTVRQPPMAAAGDVGDVQRVQLAVREEDARESLKQALALMQRGPLHRDAYDWLRAALRQSQSDGEFRITLMLLGSDPSPQTSLALVEFLESSRPPWRRRRVAGSLHGGRANVPLDRLYDQWESEGHDVVREAIAATLETHYAFGRTLRVSLHELATRPGDVPAKLLAARLAPADATHMTLLQGLVAHSGTDPRDINVRTSALAKIGSLAASGQFGAFETLMASTSDRSAAVRRVAYESIRGCVGALAPATRRDLQGKLSTAAARETDAEVVRAIRGAQDSVTRSSGAENAMKEAWEQLQKSRGK